MTEETSAGRVERGEGRAEGPTTSQLARSLYHEYMQDERHVDTVTIRFVTEGLYTAELRVRGENEAETIFIRVQD